MTDAPISAQCASGDHHLCRPDVAACACPCGRNGHPSDGYPPEPTEEQLLREELFARGAYEPVVEIGEAARDESDAAFDRLTRSWPEQLLSEIREVRV